MRRYLLGLILSFAVPAVQADAMSGIGWPTSFDPSKQIGFSYLADTTADNGGVDPYPNCGGLIYHPGVDVNESGTSGDGDKGEPIYAIADGIVLVSDDAAGWNPLLLQISLENRTYYVAYGHSEVEPSICRSTVNGKDYSFNRVSAGDNVVQGQQIGCLWDRGTSSSHLHFEVRRMKPQHEDPTRAKYFCELHGRVAKDVAKSYVDPLAFIQTDGYIDGRCVQLDTNYVSQGVFCWLDQPGHVDDTCTEGTAHKIYVIAAHGISSQWTFSRDTLGEVCSHTGTSSIDLRRFLSAGEIVVTGGDAGGGFNPSAQTDLVPHPKEYNAATGATYNVGDAISAGTQLKLVGVTEVTGADASVGMSSNANDVTVRWEVKIGNGDWMKAGDDQAIGKTSLTKGNRVERIWHYTVPSNVPNGAPLSIRYTVDVKGVVTEKYESNSRTETFAIAANLSWMPIILYR